MEIKFKENYRVSQIIECGCWNIPQDLMNLFPVVSSEIKEVQISEVEEDELFWDGSANRVITVKAAYNFYRDKKQTVLWKKALWRKFIPPKISLFTWKLCSQRVIIALKLFN